MPKRKSTTEPSGSNKEAKSSLSKDEFHKVCSQLEKTIVDEKNSSAFVCGGTILIKGEAAKLKNQTPKPSNPVTIFWEPKDGLHAKKLVLPLKDSNDDCLRQLVTDCEPASFGRGQEDVMDPEYRKAGKLEPSQFVTSFHSIDFGLQEIIENILAPPLDLEKKVVSRRIEAELYKLNVYSGPSGLFQKHVDTPRSKSQIGSLVVCLPSAFKGGNLIVRHNGKEIDFDWEHQSADVIQWAAFYSDCEHEIKTITEGDRITLTYNLCIAEPLEADAPISLLDAKRLALYEELKSTLQNPGFMPKGGVLGIFCSHAYPHTASNVETLLPRGLKGADMTVYVALRSLGIKVDVLPVVIDDKESYIDYMDQEDEEYEGSLAVINDEYKRQMAKKQAKKDAEKKEAERSPERSAEYLEYKHLGRRVHVGAKLQPHIVADSNKLEEDGGLLTAIRTSWPRSEYSRPITWIANPHHEELAMSYMAYGNEYSQETVYSYAAVMAVIPPYTERQISK
ncbi:uncharacterized protein N7503_002804 [Penicillium pulvis]|uniref:uncharacterized protein n=1 Tax=Penicillium pulvis TaxID=1562058 RepID=UPI002548E622|nr:uncharacterized protein N7503_002804 [Penicillium pulvis]KAJ5810586.1 hypothetical protein N7503_002804 [Penicillium pulvis]